MRYGSLKTVIPLAVALVGAAYLGSALTAPPAEAQRKVQWKMPSAFGSKLPHLGTGAVRFVDEPEPNAPAQAAVGRA